MDAMAISRTPFVHLLFVELMHVSSVKYSGEQDCAGSYGYLNSQVLAITNLQIN
jgi:hypothetical protein